jgi:hypothetical protein
MMLSEHAAEVKLTEGRGTPNAVIIKTPIAFIQAHKFGGVQSTRRCACDGRGSAVSHGHRQDYRHDNEDCGKDERQQLHERFPRKGKYRPQFLT